MSYTIDETRCNHVQMGTRRWRLPRSYIKHIDLRIVPRKLEKEGGGVQSLEMLQSRISHPKNKSQTAWQECMQQCKPKKTQLHGGGGDRKEWNACVHACPKDHGNGEIMWLDFVSYLDYVLMIARKGIWCVLILQRTLALSMCLFVLRFVYIFGFKKKKNTLIKGT